MRDRSLVDHRSASPAECRRRRRRASGLPPSGLAARIMPFDSIPISLAGFRLNTMPTVLPDELLGLVGLGDAGDQRPLLGADVDRQLHQLARVGHLLGGEHLGDAQIDLHEVVDGDPVAGGRGPAPAPAAGRPAAARSRLAVSSSSRPRRGLLSFRVAVVFSSQLRDRHVSTLSASTFSARGHSASPFTIVALAVVPPRRGVEPEARSAGVGSPTRRRISAADAGMIGSSRIAGDAHRFGHVEQHLAETVGLPLVALERPRLGLGDVLVGGVDDPERGGRALLEREAHPCAADSRASACAATPASRPGAAAGSSRPPRYFSAIAAIAAHQVARGCWRDRRCSAPAAAPTRNRRRRRRSLP